MSSNPGGAVGWSGIKKKICSANHFFCWGIGPELVTNTLGSIPGKFCGGAAG